jgi:glutathione S-transferase
MIDKVNLKLFVDRQFTSPYAMSVFVTLLEKGLPFDLEQIDLDRHQHLTPPYCDDSLTARVPTLAHENFFLSESTAIVEYLEEVFPLPDYPSVFPQSTVDRARARQIQAWLRSDLMPIRTERSTEVIFFEPTTVSLSKSGCIALAKLVRVTERLLKHHSQNLFGEWCIADTELALMLNRLVLNGDDIPQRLKDYASFQWQRPAVKQWIDLDRS